MGKKIIQESVFPEIVECYNGKGKSAAHTLLREKYGIRNPGNIIKRIRNCGKYSYDPETDRFSEPVAEDAGLFMGLDELCGGTAIKPAEAESSVADSRAATMERLVHELISDRLLTLSRYITLDTATRTILIDSTSMSADGFRIVTH